MKFSESNTEIHPMAHLRGDKCPIEKKCGAFKWERDDRQASDTYHPIARGSVIGKLGKQRKLEIDVNQIEGRRMRILGATVSRETWATTNTGGNGDEDQFENNRK